MSENIFFPDSFQNASSSIKKMSSSEEIKAEVLPEDYNIYDLSFKIIFKAF